MIWTKTKQLQDLSHGLPRAKCKSLASQPAATLTSVANHPVEPRIYTAAMDGFVRCYDLKDSQLRNINLILPTDSKIVSVEFLVPFILLQCSYWLSTFWSFCFGLSDKAGQMFGHRRRTWHSWNIEVFRAPATESPALPSLVQRLRRAQHGLLWDATWQLSGQKQHSSRQSAQ